LYKKVIVLILIALILICVAATNTWAFFKDTETSSNNITSTSTLDLLVGSTDPMTANITLSGIKPTDSGNAASWTIKNKGSSSGSFSISLGTVSNQENTRNEIETASGDTSDSEGELGGLVKIAIWMDTGNNGWGSGDYYLNPGSSLTKVNWSSGTTLPTGAYFTINTFSGKSSATLQTITSNTTAGNIKIEYSFPVTDYHDNAAQSDSSLFDIVFNLRQ
jgi:predicted ribosomally synthesized peptide with SipW-like signal peptide